MSFLEKPVTFVIVPGCWNPPEFWDSTRFELEELGHNSVVPKLPTNDPEATFDHYAQAVADECKNENNVVLVAHSRAGNIAPRVPDLVAVEGLIYVCASLEPSTSAAIGRPRQGEMSKMPPKNPVNYADAFIKRKDRLTDIDPEIARPLLFSDCTEEVKDWAVAHLIPQRRSDEEPPLREWPNVPEEYIVCTEDLATNPEWQRYVAVNWLGINPTELASGHSPFLSCPGILARILVSLGADHV